MLHRPKKNAPDSIIARNGCRNKIVEGYVHLSLFCLKGKMSPADWSHARHSSFLQQHLLKDAEKGLKIGVNKVLLLLE